jgi:hypothetical protein
VVLLATYAHVQASLQPFERLRVGEMVVCDNPRGTPAEASFLILTYSPFVSLAVVKNVTRSPVRGFSMVRGRFSSVVVSARCVCPLSLLYTG